MKSRNRRQWRNGKGNGIGGVNILRVFDLVSEVAEEDTPPK
jgi:hypothetical protein